MKKWLVSLIVICVIAVGIAIASYLGMCDANQKLSNATSDKVRLEIETKELTAKLSTFNGVEKADLLKVCSEKAKTDYSDYIRANSISVTEGNVTTLSPKTPNILRQAEESLRSSEKNCSDKFGG